MSGRFTGKVAFITGLARGQDVDQVSFIGSTETGRKIVPAAAGNLKRLTLEMGGKGRDIVFADADLDKAVPDAAIGILADTGQICCAGSRIFVQRLVYEEFAQRLVAFAGALPVGPSTDRSTLIGPIVSETQLDRVLGCLDIGQRRGRGCWPGVSGSRHRSWPTATSCRRRCSPT